MEVFFRAAEIARQEIGCLRRFSHREVRRKQLPFIEVEQPRVNAKASERVSRCEATSWRQRCPWKGSPEQRERHDWTCVIDHGLLHCRSCRRQQILKHKRSDETK